MPRPTAPLRPLARLLAAAAVLALVVGPLGAQAPAPEAAPGTASETAPPPPLLAPLSNGVELALPSLDPALPSPAEHLGYPLGERFTHHHAILDYLERLAQVSDRVTLWRYGSTWEDRPLVLLAVSTPENLARLEEIREANLRLADPRGLGAEERRRLLDEQPVLVWLSYGVHGNESSSAEVAMGAAHVLAAAGGRWEQVLGDTVVLIDPLVNPDGRERFVQFYRQTRGARPDPSPAAAEHHEPWPGGRQNHYVFDLNRDWAWATQIETRHRLEEYRQWEPQVHVDYHEMFGESTYFFPPAADPVNAEIDPRVVSWLQVFGRGNATAFDAYGWPYFKGEVFDLFYPGYGDSYPAFRGAVGMTYEMAGHGRAGAAVERADGTILTLADRVAQHLTTSLATVDTAAHNRRRLLEDFAAGREAASAAGPAFLWDPAAPEAGELTRLLTTHGIVVETLERPLDLPVRELRAGALDRGDTGETTRRFEAGTRVVRTAQPLGNLARALLDRSPELDEEFLARQRRLLESNQRTEFYDITSWSLPLAFNLPAWRVDGAATGALEGATGSDATAPAPRIDPAGGIGWLLPPHGVAGHRLTAALLADGVHLRLALEGFRLEGRDWPAGTLYVPRLGNPENLADLLERHAGGAGVDAIAVSTAYSERGISLGSDRVRSLVPSRVGLLGGEGISATSFGALWHLFDREVGLDYSRLDLAGVGNLDLGAFDVLVLPDAWGLDHRLSESDTSALTRWVEDGGVLVVIEGAHDWARAQELSALEPWSPEDGESSDSPLARRPVSVPGATLATRLDPYHPLAVGLAAPPPALVAGTRALRADDDTAAVLTVAADDPVLAGVVWSEAEDRLAGSVLVATESRGRGTVVTFAQDPAFRGFWRGTMPLLLNAVLYGPTLAGGGGY